MRFKNQLGVSMVELMVGLGVMALASALYATHMRNAHRSESALRVKSAINQMATSASEYLTSRDICDRNIGQAFNGVVLNQSTADGNDIHHKIQNKGFVDATGTLQFKDIYTVDQNFDGGKVWIKDISYKMVDLIDGVTANPLYNKSGKLQVRITFERCNDGGAVYRVDESGVKTRVCNSIIEMSRVVEKPAAFKTTAGVIEKFACAGSQDALMDEANKYTDEKVCALEAKLMAKLGSAGTTACGWSVSIIEKFRTDGTVTIPQVAVSGSLRFKMIGGGGGGGGGDRHQGGTGGKAGEYWEQPLPDLMKGGTCVLTPGGGGYGGAGGTNADNGADGSPSSILCSNNSAIFTNKTVQGGLKGIGETISNGSPGENSFWPSTGGTSSNASDGGLGGIGAGGGGGADFFHPGGAGGRGAVTLYWTEAEVRDKSGNVVAMP